jgi:hypothetical protein
VLTREEAINRGCSGPVARASGVTRDLRKDEPYLAYDDFDFEVCCAEEGDCFARYLVRMAEMRESVKIIEQAIDNLPPGPINVGVDRRTILPPKQQVFSTIEGLITHFELSMSNRGSWTIRTTSTSESPLASPRAYEPTRTTARTLSCVAAQFTTRRRRRLAFSGTARRRASPIVAPWVASGEGSSFTG